MDLGHIKEELKDMGLEVPEAEENKRSSSAKKPDGHPREIVSVFAYLIGVKKSVFESEDQPPKMETYEKLEKNKNAGIMRCLCMLRTEIERNYKKIRLAMQQDHKQLWGLADEGLVSGDALVFLTENNVKPDIKNAWRPDEYTVRINGFINQRIGTCAGLFPSYVKWDYIRELFIMPRGTTREGCEEAARVYYDNLCLYPYKCYINWQPREVGNLLYNDERFVTTLYDMHGEEFAETGKVSGLSTLTKKSIETFIRESGKLDMIVDCENSDPYKLAAALRNMDGELSARINKLILVDDPNTEPIWKCFQKFIKGITIKHINNERILSQKSLVDIRLTAQAMLEYLKNNVDSFILVSSDSDFWGLMEGMLENDEDGINARFLLFVEREHTSPALTKVLRDHDIYYAYLDQFYTGNCEDIKQQAVLMEMRDYIDKNFFFNVNDMYEDALAKTHVGYTEDEKKHFYNKYVRTIRMEIAPDGQVTPVLKKT